MKTIKMIGLSLVSCALFAFIPMSAEAHGHHHGGGWGRHYGHNWGVRAFVGVPGPMLYYSPYTYTYNPYPSTVIIEQSAQPVQAPAPVLPQTPQYWYFCESANGYYPSVPFCQEGWKMIPVTPSAR